MVVNPYLQPGASTLCVCAEREREREMMMIREQRMVAGMDWNEQCGDEEEEEEEEERGGGEEEDARRRRRGRAFEKLWFGRLKCVDGTQVINFDNEFKFSNIV